LSLYADDLVFHGNVFQGNLGDVYKLEFGVNLSRAAPVYDIVVVGILFAALIILKLKK